MKTFFRSLSSYLAFLLLTSNIQAQLSNVVSSYDLRLNNKHVDYCSEAPSLCMDIQIKAADGAEDFLVGEYTIFLNYNANAISFKSYNSIGFDENVMCNILDITSYSPYDDAQNTALELQGNGKWNVSNTGGGFVEDFECSIVTNSVWENFGTICFYITSSNDQTTDLRFNTIQTKLNNDNDDVIQVHSQNNLEAFDEYPIQNTHFSILLEGAYQTGVAGVMKTELLDNGLLPTSQPFNRSPWNYTGTENVASSNDFPDDVVDWVLIEARDANDNNVVLETKAAFLLANSLVIDADPTVCRGVKFDNLSPYESYYFSIKTRNHLAVMSENAVEIPNNVVFDFTWPENVSDGLAQLFHVGNGFYALKAGDINSDGRINTDDINIYYDESSLLNVYLDSDVNFNSTISVEDFNHFSTTNLNGVLQIQY